MQARVPLRRMSGCCFCVPQAMSIVKSCSLNLAICFLKTGQHEQVVIHASSVLESGDPGNLKALYRRGMAYKVGLAPCTKPAPNSVWPARNQTSTELCLAICFFNAMCHRGVP